MPIDVLPTEIFVHILILHAGERWWLGGAVGGYLFQDLMRVCRRWRSVCFNTAEFWSYSSNSQDDLELPRLLASLSTSSVLPIYLRWSFAGGAETITAHASALRECMKQVRVLSLDLIESEDWVAVFPPEVHLNAPHLRNAVIDSRRFCAERSSLRTGKILAPSLRSLLLGDTSLHALLIRPSMAPVPSLTIDDPSMNWDDAVSAIDVYKPTFLRVVWTPTRYENDGHILSHAPSMPRVRILQLVDSRNARWALYPDWIIRILKGRDYPLLEVLVCRKLWFYTLRALNVLWDTHHFTRLRVLRLGRIEIRNNGMIEGLRPLEYLECLDFVISRDGEGWEETYPEIRDFFQDLTWSWKNTSTGERLLPRLKEIVIQVEDLENWEISALVAFVRSRHPLSFTTETDEKLRPAVLQFLGLWLAPLDDPEDPEQATPEATSESFSELDATLRRESASLLSPPLAQHEFFDPHTVDWENVRERQEKNLRNFAWTNPEFYHGRLNVEQHILLEEEITPL